MYGNITLLHCDQLGCAKLINIGGGFTALYGHCSNDFLCRIL